MRLQQLIRIWVDVNSVALIDLDIRVILLILLVQLIELIEAAWRG